MLTVAVLGPVEVRRDTRLLTVPAGKTTELLVHLALHAGTRVSADRLIDDLWADTAASTARNTLQSKVSQLRRALGDSGLVVVANGGYVLDVDPLGVDALRVGALAATVAEHRRHADVGAVLAEAELALSLFRGDVLVDAGTMDWVVPHRTRLEEIRLGLLETQVAARVEIEAGGDLIGDIEALLAAHPLREGLWASLITALYRGGRQADALAAFGRVRRLLADELGLDPGPELRALERQILDHDVAAPVATAHLPAGSTVTRTNVSTFGTPTIGRQRETAAILDELARARLVTIVGPAGVGKTRLAIDVARRIEVGDGPWLVRLDSVEHGEAIAQLVADTVGAAGGVRGLGDRFAGTDSVLVLDNCEHVVEHAAQLAQTLLQALPRIRLLTTSQLPLGVDGEVVHRLDPLPVEDAVVLFTARAVAARRIDGDPDERLIAELCRTLDGLPLAIELAAARTQSLSVVEITRRLGDRFALLRDPSGRRPARRGGLAEAIAWSHDLLFPDDQRGLWALSCFADGAPLDAAEHVLAALDVPAPLAVDVFDRLVDRSLITAEVADDGAVRYRMLDSIRTFAAERLRTAAGDGDARRAHAEWVAALAARCAVDVRGPDQPWCVGVVRTERANIDAALAWTAEQQPDLGVRIANGFGWTWVVVGDGSAGAARVRDALAHAPATGRRAAIDAWLVAAWLETSAGDLDLAAADLARATELAATVDDGRISADVDRHRAFLRMQQDRPAEALDAAAASLATAERLDLTWEAAGASNLLAYAAMALGDTAGAGAAAADALAWREQLGDAWGQMHADAMLGRIAAADGRLDEAAERLGRAAAISADLGFTGQTALHLTHLGHAEQQAGDQLRAIATFEQAAAAARAAGDRRIAATIRLHLARSMVHLGRDDEAASALQENIDWYVHAGGGEGQRGSKALLDTITARSTDR